MSCGKSFSDAPKGGIKNSTKVAKKCRGNKMLSFTRRYNEFHDLVKAKVQRSLLKEAFDVMDRAFWDLKKSHEDYSLLVEEEIIDAEGDYLEEPFQLLRKADAVFCLVLNKWEKGEVGHIEKERPMCSLSLS